MLLRLAQACSLQPRVKLAIYKKRFLDIATLRRTHNTSMELPRPATLRTPSRVAAGPIEWAGVERIVVLRALFLGDMLCAVPALRALRREAPQAEITFAGLPWAQEFARRYRDYIDQFIEFPGFPGIAEQSSDAATIVAFLADMQRRQFDVAIQLHGSGEQSNSASALFGARRLAGHYAPGGYCPDPATFLPYPVEGSEVRRNLAMVAHLGVRSQGEHLELPLYRDDWMKLNELLADSPAAGQPYVCVHAGAKWNSRRWPVERFAAVGRALVADGYHVVLTGSGGETRLVERLGQLLHAPHTNLCGRTDLGTLGALLQRARLLITNDTGLSHVAAATRTPSVVTVLGSDVERWRPLDERRHRVVMDLCECRPSTRPECLHGLVCADRISPQTVYRTCCELLQAYADDPLKASVGPEQRYGRLPGQSEVATAGGAAGASTCVA